MVKRPPSFYHQYKLVDIKNGTNFYDEFIRNRKDEKRNKKQKLKSLLGGVIYTSNNGKNSFDIGVKEYDDETGIFVGRHGKCFFGRINKYQPGTLIIQNFTYYNDCNTIRDFEKGKGMKRLMNTLIRYTKEHYPEIKQLQLDDEAVLLCESKIDNSIYRIYLPRLYFLKYGMGYYQYNFGFKLMNKRFNIILQDNKKKLENFKLVKDNLIKDLKIGNLTQLPEIQKDVTTLFNDKNILNSVEISNQLELRYDCLFLNTLINYIYAEAKIRDLMGASHTLTI